MAISTILVDDSDTSRISYDSAWGTAGSSFEHDSTTHHTNNARAVLSFPFNGTSVAVYGTVSANQASNPLTCSVDGTAVTAPLIPPSAQNQYNRVFCSVDSLSGDEQHNLIMTVDGSSNRFFLDYFLYNYDDTSPQSAVPNPETSPARRMIDDGDSAVEYGGGLGLDPWTQEGGADQFSGTTHRTTTIGATATFRFTGTSVGVYGTIGENSILSPPWAASFKIDDEDEERIRPEIIRDRLAHQVLLFDSDDLEEGEHTLVITNLLTGTSPLAIDYFQVAAPVSFGLGVAPPPPPPPPPEESESSTESSTEEPTTTDEPSNTPTLGPSDTTVTETKTETGADSGETGSSTGDDSSSNTGMIAGVSIGAVAVLVIIVILGAWIYRKRKRRSDEAIDFGPGDHTVSPFPVADNYSDKHDPSPYGAGAAVAASSGYGGAQSSQHNLAAAPLPYRSTHTSSPAPQSTTMYSDQPSYGGYGNQGYSQYSYGSGHQGYDNTGYGNAYQNYDQQGYYTQQAQQAQHHVGASPNPYGGEQGYYPSPAPAGGSRAPRIFDQATAQDNVPPVPPKSTDALVPSSGAGDAARQHRRNSSGSVAQLPWTQ